MARYKIPKKLISTQMVVMVTFLTELFSDVNQVLISAGCTFSPFLMKLCNRVQSMETNKSKLLNVQTKMTAMKQFLMHHSQNIRKCRPLYGTQTHQIS